jgi:deoxycytidylate deaminase
VILRGHKFADPMPQKAKAPRNRRPGALTPPERPELFIGLVGAVGTELDLVAGHLGQSLEKFGYSTSIIRLASLLHALPRYRGLPRSKGKPIDEYIDSHMTAGNDFRQLCHRADAVALLGVGEIIEERKEAGKQFGEVISGRAYIFRSLKNPAEVRTLREIYGASFYLVAAYSSYYARRAHLAKRIAESHNKFPIERHFPITDYLMLRDQEELGFSHGQNTRDTFHRADLFVDMSDGNILRRELNRFTELLFGNTFQTPSKAEYAMFHAQAAALRSAELGRQVGAAISTEEGDIVAVGTNEVPKAGGGLYWCDDRPDRREFREGCDSNDQHKRQLIGEMFGYLKDAGWLNRQKSRLSLDELVSSALAPDKPVIPKDSKVRNLIEYGRAVHAEMAALTDAARRGVSVSGCHMYVTTFPCHLCARQIVAAGIKRVFYVEPYAKSLAAELYPDSISVDGAERSLEQVPFEPFGGIAPRQYMNLFLAGKRKDENGDALQFRPGSVRLRYHDLHRAYLENEDQMIKNLGDEFKREKTALAKAMPWRPNAIRGLAVQSGR